MTATPLNEALSEGLDDLELAFFSALPRREWAIAEAIRWPTGTPIRPHVTLYGVLPDGHTIRFGKPGKEASRSKKPNVNDMTPQLWMGRRDTTLRPSFAELYGWLEDLRFDSSGRDALDIIATLLFRDVYMLDHRIAPDGWRYEPPTVAITGLLALAPMVGPMPTLSFLHLMDAIALNEDVKYCASGTPTKKGRHNNLLTAVRMITVMLDRERLSSAVGQLVQGGGSGVSPLEPREAKRRLPLTHGIGEANARAALAAEVQIRDCLAGFRGKTISQLDEDAGIQRNMQDTGWRNDAIVEALERECMPAVMEYLRGEAVLRVVRVDQQVRPKQYVRLCRLDMSALPAETWETSLVARQSEKRYIFVLLAEDADGDERVARAKFHSFGPKNLKSIKKVWARARRAVTRGRLDLLPKSSTRDTRVCLVNTQDSRSNPMTRSGGSSTTRRSVYFDSDFLRDVLDRP